MSKVRRKASDKKKFCVIGGDRENSFYADEEFASTANEAMELAIKRHCEDGTGYYPVVAFPGPMPMGAVFADSMEVEP